MASATDLAAPDAMRRMTIAEFHDAIRAQNAPSREDITFVCPMCGVHQSARDLIAAGAGGDFDSVERFLGFSCVGRWLCADTPRTKIDGKPCNWTLGGLFRLHKLEVVDEAGKAHPRFELASAPKVQS
jgi:hypothetical protein